MKLNELSQNPGARKQRVRVGRGIGSGKGKTCGRGVKGQKSRTGVSIHGFEGGQMPIHRRLPKRGFNSLNKENVAIVNFSRLQKAVEDKKIDPKKPVTHEVLVAAGLIRPRTKIVKLLATGALKTALTLEVDRASAAALQAVEKAGGKIVLPSAAA